MGDAVASPVWGLGGDKHPSVILIDFEIFQNLK